MGESTQSQDAIRTQLKKVLASKLFRSSELPKKFLSFVVLKTLEEKTAEIKEYSIGADAFGRGEDFDPRIDSVVRVVARRVRDRLTEYYRHEGRNDSLFIEIPTGSYVPSFSSREIKDISTSNSPSPSPVSPSPGSAEGLIGTKIAHYEILELIARGGSGLVYRAEDLRLNRGVAFKVLFPEFASDAASLERFIREARSASAVNHPNICAIYDVGEYQGRAYIVMELAEGKTLDRFIDGKPLALEMVFDLGIQVSDALTTVHAQGIAHRDVRSANIVVNSRCQAKLLDFSAAQGTRGRSSSEVIAARGQSGSASVEPQEAIERTLLPGRRERVDIVGMGAILFEMATGRRHVAGSNPSPHLLNPTISLELDQLIQKAITDSPSLGTVHDLRDELLRLKRLRELRNAPADLSFRKLLTSKRVWASIVMTAGLVSLIYLAARPGSPPRILSYKQLTHDAEGKLDAFAVGTPAPLVTDGSRLFFNEISGSQVVIRQVSASGGETVPLRSGSNEPLVVMGLSPDRSELLATDFFQQTPDHTLFALPLPGGSPRPIGSLVGHDGVWSPDGTHICYAYRSRLYLAASDGTNSKMIADLPGLPSWPRWSPDGSKLRVTVQDSKGETALWDVPLRGGQPRLLLPGWNDHGECCGSWSPDGNYFIFQSSRQGSTGLWLIRERHWRFGDSRVQPIRLTEGPLEVWAPTFSTSGDRVFAVVQQRRGELVRYDPKLHNFERYLAGISADHVEFSRDGQWIAYCAFPEQTIWRSRLDGSERLQLSSAPMSAIFPRWSPDGQRIAFMGTFPKKAVKIFIASSNGGDPQPLLPGDSPEIDPNWSPDGNSIMFAQLPSVNEIASGRPSIQILDLRTHRLSLLPGSEGLTAPRWSPDGRFVVATALSQGKWSKPGVLIFDFNTKKWAPLEDDPIDNKWWSRDGKYFYFDKYTDNDTAIYRVRLADHAIERITSLSTMRRSFNSMGWWMGLTPDDSPMVLRDTSIQEIYALDFKVR